MPISDKQYNSRDENYFNIRLHLIIKRVICHIIQVCKITRTLRVYDFGGTAATATGYFKLNTSDINTFYVGAQHPIEHMVYGIPSSPFKLGAVPAVSFIFGVPFKSFLDGWNGNLYPDDIKYTYRGLLLNQIGFAFYLKINKGNLSSKYINTKWADIINAEWDEAFAKVNIDFSNIKIYR